MIYPAHHHSKKHAYYAIACYHDDYLDGVYEMTDLEEATRIAELEASGSEEDHDDYGYSHVCVVKGDEHDWDLDHPLDTFRRP